MEAVAVVRRNEPDVVLMDIRMPVMDGIEATRRMVDGMARPPRIIILTTFNVDRYVYAALAPHRVAALVLEERPPPVLLGLAMPSSVPETAPYYDREVRPAVLSELNAPDPAWWEALATTNHRHIVNDQPLPDRQCT
ncbi:response regulator [Verrucosispora sp. FIM060022]|uniref:Two component LuxR family transcriptional regulator n=1 Tax=Verrucosispora sp. MS100047 TaxID=1410949 RepID=A0A097CSV1_9ACTN|nr:two component LuxR family transcriptional regulator [Verrucosispora sp. MS100047]RUL90354.1 response regulator [Verrucosispora sp. FIM060022]